MKYPEYNTLNPNHCREIYIKINYKEFHQYLISNYPEELSFGEKLYWFYNNINDYPKCKNCGNKTKFINALFGYSDYCSKKCSNSSEEKKTKTKQTNRIKFGGNAPACSKEVILKTKQTKFERHGDENFNNRAQANQTLLERYNGVGNASEVIKAKQQKTMIDKYGKDNCMFIDDIKDKMRANNMEKYGVDWVFKRKEIISKSIQTCIERYETPHFTNPEQAVITREKNNLEKYGVKSNFEIPTAKQKSIQTCVNRYGGDINVENHMQLPGVINKIIETKRENKTFNSSSIEEKFNTYLIENNISFIRQYRSELYPYACDFYFPDYNLYLEIQGMWTHGGHAFNPDDNEDKLKLEKWKQKNTKFFDSAIQVWTITDPEKRKTAKQNKLNYLEVFTNNINELIYEYKRAIKGL